ncbi:MAG: ROK family protein [Acutalibacteraceae bacterium]|nr:ROK family protein [Acutalibacteraceae bacterium]
MNYCVGIDIGGTKTSVCIADDNARPIKTVTFPTEAILGAESLVKRIGNTYKELLSELSLSAGQVDFCGVACPGPLDVKQGRIIHIATMGFKNVPIREMLSNELKLPVYLENDANCAALAESELGVAKGKDPLVYVTISTGIGSGIIVNGQILSGGFSSAGELGHLTVVPDGRQCPCGKKGCLELYSSGTAIARDGSANKGKELSTKEVFDLYRSGDREIKEIVDLAAEDLGLALSSVYHIIDPACIVLGGSVTKAYDCFKESLLKALEKYTQPVQDRNINIEISSFDGEQVILGALIYGKGEHGKNGTKS